MTVVTWIGVKGLEKTIKKLTKLRDLTKTPEFNMAVHTAADESIRYWGNNVYRYFNARISMGKGVSGQLGDSIKYSITMDRITFSMRPIIHEYRGKSWEYGHYLRKGTSPSMGAYSPRIDKRVPFGTHPGVSRTKYWVPWQQQFKSITRLLTNNKVRLVVRQISRS